MSKQIFDRDCEDYVAVALLLDPVQRDMLDEALTGRPAQDWEAAIDEYAVKKSLSHGERAKLRIAVYFYNGAIRLHWEDPRYLDPGNRERFVLAMRAHLDLPPNLRAVAIVVPDRGNLGRAG